MFSLVEPLSRRLLLLLVEHVADASHNGQANYRQQAVEEELEPAGGRGQVVGVVAVRSGVHRRGNDQRAVLARGAVRRVEHVRLDADDVVVVAQLAGGRRHAHVEAGGQADALGVEALLPVPRAVDVGPQRQRVIVVANAEVGVVVDAAKL